MADKYIDESEKIDEVARKCDADPTCQAQVVKLLADRAARSEAAEKDWNDRPVEKSMNLIIGLGLLATLIYYFFFRDDPKSKKKD